MTTVALFGAGGKMGMRLGRNLKGSRYDVRPVEVNPAGIERLKAELDWHAVNADAALKEAEIVILAVPDTAIGKVSHAIVGQAGSGHHGDHSRCRSSFRRAPAQAR